MHPAQPDFSGPGYFEVEFLMLSVPPTQMSPEAEELIYHIATQNEWDDHASAATYAPLAHEKDGFIHCCDLHQLEPVANQYFPGRDDLVVLELVPTKLEPETRFEQSGEEKFPHVYGPINKDAINRVTRVRCNANGLFDGAFDAL